MNPIKGLFNSIFKSANATGGIFSFYNQNSMPKMSEKQYLQAYTGWVFTCVNAIAERVSDIDLFLQKKQPDGTWKNVPQSDAIDILNYVNPFYTFEQLVFATSAYMELDGNAFWTVIKTKGGVPIELWPLDPTRVTVVKDKQTFIKGYVYRTESQEQIPFEPDQVIHFKRFNPQSPYRGIGTVEAASVAISSDSYASDMQRNFFGNAAMPSGAIKTQQKLTDEQFNRIKANFDAKYKGVENAYKMLLLQGGMEWQTISPSFQEMQFTESRKDLRDEILAYFRVPKVILGITEDVNLASAQASEYIFAKYMIKPKMKSFVGFLTEFLLPLMKVDNKSYRVWFTDPVPENTTEKLSIIASGRGVGGIAPWMTGNEARGLFNMPKDDDPEMDEIPEQSTYINLSPNGQPTDSTGGDGEGNNNDNGKKAIQIRKAAKKKEQIATEAKLRHEAIAKAVPSALKVNLDLNEKLKSMVLSNLQQQKSIKPKHRKDTLDILQKALSDSDKLIKLTFNNYNDWVGLLKDGVTAEMLKSFTSGGKNSLIQVGVDSSFDLKNPRAVKALQEHALENATSYSDTMKSEISQILIDGVDNGDSIDDMTASIGQYFDSGSQWKAERLARTETIDAYTQGSLEGARQSGVVEKKQWVFDDGECESFVCPDNADLGYIDLGEDFPEGDNGDGPPAHPNCECGLIYQTKDLSDD